LETYLPEELPARMIQVIRPVPSHVIKDKAWFLAETPGNWLKKEARRASFFNQSIAFLVAPGPARP
jgi:hypothetical protein